MLSVRNTPPVPLEYLSLGLLVIWYFFSLFYFIGYWAWCGQTPGQMATGIKVVRRNGQNTSVWISILRYLVGYTINYLFLLSFIVPVIVPLLVTALQKQKRGIPDLIAGTLVVHAGEGRG
jgi:uncharacterized RDD family membrane protein YckC